MARPRKPLALKLADGSFRRDRDGGRAEPQFPTGVPVKPVWLNDAAGEQWDRLVPLLAAMRVLTPIDGFALARYCTLFARWRQCEVAVTEYGEVTPDGKPNPAGSTATKLAGELLRLEAAFGMSPKARQHVAAPQAKAGEDDKVSKYFQPRDA